MKNSVRRLSLISAGIADHLRTPRVLKFLSAQKEHISNRFRHTFGEFNKVYVGNVFPSRLQKHTPTSTLSWMAPVGESSNCATVVLRRVMSPHSQEFWLQSQLVLHITPNCSIEFAPLVECSDDESVAVMKALNSALSLVPNERAFSKLISCVDTHEFLGLDALHAVHDASVRILLCREPLERGGRLQSLLRITVTTTLDTFEEASDVEVRYSSSAFSFHDPSSSVLCEARDELKGTVRQSLWTCIRRAVDISFGRARELVEKIKKDNVDAALRCAVLQELGSIYLTQALGASSCFNDAIFSTSITPHALVNATARRTHRFDVRLSESPNAELLCIQTGNDVPLSLNCQSNTASFDFLHPVLQSTTRRGEGNAKKTVVNHIKARVDELGRLWCASQRLSDLLEGTLSAFHGNECKFHFDAKLFNLACSQHRRNRCSEISLMSVAIRESAADVSLNVNGVLFTGDFSSSVANAAKSVGCDYNLSPSKYLPRVDLHHAGVANLLGRTTVVTERQSQLLLQFYALDCFPTFIVNNKWTPDLNLLSMLQPSKSMHALSSKRDERQVLFFDTSVEVPDVSVMIQTMRDVLGLTAQELPQVTVDQLVYYDIERHLLQVAGDQCPRIRIKTTLTVEWPGTLYKAVVVGDASSDDCSLNNGEDQTCDSIVCAGPLRLLIRAICEIFTQVVAGSGVQSIVFPTLVVRNANKRKGLLDFLMWVWFRAPPQERYYYVRKYHVGEQNSADNEGKRVDMGQQSTVTHFIGGYPGPQQHQLYTATVQYSKTLAHLKMVRGVLLYDILGCRVMFAAVHASHANQAALALDRCAWAYNTLQDAQRSRRLATSQRYSFVTTGGELSTPISLYLRTLDRLGFEVDLLPDGEKTVLTIQRDAEHHSIVLECSLNTGVLQQIELQCASVIEKVLGAKAAVVVERANNRRPVLTRDGYSTLYDAAAYCPNNLLGEALQGIAARYECHYDHLENRQVRCTITILALSDLVLVKGLVLGFGTGGDKNSAWRNASLDALTKNFPTLRLQVEKVMEMTNALRDNPSKHFRSDLRDGLRFQFFDVSSSLRKCALSPSFVGVGKNDNDAFLSCVDGVVNFFRKQDDITRFSRWDPSSNFRKSALNACLGAVGALLKGKVCVAVSEASGKFEFHLIAQHIDKNNRIHRSKLLSDVARELHDGDASNIFLQLKRLICSAGDVDIDDELRSLLHLIRKDSEMFADSKSFRTSVRRKVQLVGHMIFGFKCTYSASSCGPGNWEAKLIVDFPTAELTHHNTKRNVVSVTVLRAKATSQSSVAAALLSCLKDWAVVHGIFN